METAFVQKVYEKATHQSTSDELSPIRIARIDKFALRTFKQLAYVGEISGSLATNTLFSLLEYYTPKKTIQKVNLWALQKKFSRIILGTNVDDEIAESFVPFGKSRDLPTSNFDNYQWRGPELATYFFNDYLKTITIVKDKFKLYDDIFFPADYPHLSLQVKCSLKRSCQILVALQGTFLSNKVAKDEVCGGHPDTDASENDVGMILLALFIL